MGEQAAAAGLAALTFDFRGHGESGGVLDAGRLARRRRRRRDAARRAAPRGWRRAGPAWAGACFCWRRAPAPSSSARWSLLCPADGASLLAGLDELESDPGSAPGGPPGRSYSAASTARRLRPFLAGLDLVEAARGLPRVLLAHARDDADVPFAHSERLAAVLAAALRVHRRSARAATTARGARRWSRARRSSGCCERRRRGVAGTRVTASGRPRAEGSGRGSAAARRPAVVVVTAEAEPPQAHLHRRTADVEPVGQPLYVAAMLARRPRAPAARA